MRFTSSNKQQFELTILGYEFPESRREGTEPNWLIVEVNVSHPEKGSWTARDPSLLTDEVETFVRWLSAIDRDECVQKELEFFEPNLKFELIDAGKSEPVLRVYLECELRPSWKPYQGLAYDLWVEFPITEVDIAEAADSLRKQLSHYPPR